MAISPDTNISLKGLDWSNRLREVFIDLRLWHKICVWKDGPELALDWVQTQIRLFSSRHPDREPLSHIISSIAFVEMSVPDKPAADLISQRAKELALAPRRKAV